MRFRSQLFAVALVSILLFPALGSAFRWVGGVNFTACYDNSVKNLAQNCSDTANQVCLFDGNGVLTNPNRIFITYEACERLCGDGYGLWETKDTLLRISLWVIPAVILIAHFHFPPLGPANIACVIAHMLADPIDTLWCLLTRITARRHLLKRAEGNRLLGAGAVATIWAAYDELDFHDPSGQFLEALARLEAPVGSYTETRYYHETNSQFKGPGLSLQSPQTDGTSRYPPDFLRIKEGREGHRFGRSKPLLHTIKAWLSPSTRRIGQPSLRRVPDYFQRWDHDIRQLDQDERPVLYFIEVAAQRLVFNRDESLLTTWISVLGLMSALMGAFVRTWANRLDNQTAHTIATVTLLLIVLPIVKLSGNIGAFTSSTAAINVIQQLRQDLTRHFGFDTGLFPPLKIRTAPDELDTARKGYYSVPATDGIQLIRLTTPTTSNTQVPDPEYNPQPDGLSRSELSEEEKQLLDWPRIAAFSGMNNSYRPQKSSSLVPRHWSLWLLTISVVWTLGFCFTPAMLISYLTPLRGFACRSLAWTTIASCWVASLVLDLAWTRLHHHSYPGKWISKPRNLWRLTCARDLFFAAVIILIVTAQQLGLYNSCFCRSGQLSRVLPGYVNMTPFTDAEFMEGWKMWVGAPSASFLVSVVCIVILERSFSESARLLSRDKKERERMILHLKRLAGMSPEVRRVSWALSEYSGGQRSK
ncbi:hypothetical protein B0T17DRAFT_519154 [Bombardia bombarda]|uniref:Uncharacterized protein n=1 Tax=Bombardia bombarda TaxID=252184 RepID=A0AA40CF34_9PEZI|nr:hypothetical protein B0T17DRAFT_519154 [Bombardia bombarda]